MMRRVIRQPAPTGAAATASIRCVSTGHKDITVAGAPTPPMIPVDPVVPFDFNPHIEWYEFPKEIYDPLYPFTREECLRMMDEKYEYNAQELAEKYGVFVNQTPRFLYWCAFTLMGIYTYMYLWSAYRAMGGHAKWNHWTAIVKASPDCPTIIDDESYLDHWQRTEMRQKDGHRYDTFWQWKPPIKEGVENPWKVELEYKDPSEWLHMTSPH